MNVIRNAVIAIATLSATAAIAQPATAPVQRDVNQQTRIVQGLRSGALNTQEAARLERGQARIDRAESQALRDGMLNARERARIDHMQDVQSRAIYREKHDAVVGDPSSPSSRRMQANVQRNVNQEARIAAGIRNGQLDNTEVARLERGQARTAAMQARAGRDGWVGAREHRRIHRMESRQSQRIFVAKHR